MKATEIANRAGELVGGDRKDAYGDAEEGLARVAAIWNGIMQAAGKAPAAPLNPFDVAQMMAGLKMARGYTGPYRADNAIDQAGWSSIAGEVAEKFRN
jgi:hypothetical protein